MNNRVYSMLGIAAKSGHVASGGYAVEKAIKSRQAFLILLAEDASANTAGKYQNLAEYYRIPLEVYGTGEELGRAIGKEFRVAVVVTDEKLAEAVADKITAHKTE